MYAVLLGAHNILRWAVLLAAAYALWRAYRGWLGRRAWGRADRLGGLLFAITLDVQVLLGAVLYLFVSPLTRAAFADLAGAFQSAALRFFLFDHMIGMLVALALVHIGSARARRAAPDRAHRQAALFHTPAALAVLLTIPWDRALLPGLS